MAAESTSSDAQSVTTSKSWSFYAIGLAAFHLLALAAIWTGVPWEAVALCFGLWALRMFAITAGYHRYFSHRTYKMGRVMQFVMAFLSQTSMQRGVLWWAAHHRHHHKHSDEPEDVHSPEQDGFFWAHIGWILDPEWADTDMSKVKDLAQYPELRFLNRFHHVPGLVVALGCFLWMGWAGLIVGFVWSTVLLWHSTFTINSLAHVYGSRRYETDDDSRNSLLLALLTFGEGWHNNHHHYQASTRQGFYWWEIDMTYYILWGMSKVGLVSDLREPPQHVVEDRPHPAKRLRMAAQQARSDFDDRVTEVKNRAQLARQQASDRADVLGRDIASRIEEMSHDVEDRVEQLRNSVDDVRRGAHEKVERLASDATQRADELHREMAMRMAELRNRAEDAGDRAAEAIDDIAEESKIQLQQGTSVSQV